MYENFFGYFFISEHSQKNYFVLKNLIFLADKDTSPIFLLFPAFFPFHLIKKIFSETKALKSFL